MGYVHFCVNYPKNSRFVTFHTGKADEGEQIALYDEGGFFALGEVRVFDGGLAIKPVKQFDV